jgi:hypothetical protein
LREGGWKTEDSERWISSRPSQGHFGRRPPGLFGFLGQTGDLGSDKARLFSARPCAGRTREALTAGARMVTLQPLQTPAVSRAPSGMTDEFRSRPTTGALRHSSNNGNLSNRLQAGHQACPSALRQRPLIWNARAGRRDLDQRLPLRLKFMPKITLGLSSDGSRSGVGSEVRSHDVPL